MDEHELGRLLRLLRPAPPGWAEAAAELPFLGAELTDILARARDDGRFRDALRTDADSALREQGYDLSPSVVAHLMRLLPDDGPAAGRSPAGPSFGTATASSPTAAGPRAAATPRGRPPRRSRRGP